MSLPEFFSDLQTHDVFKDTEIKFSFGSLGLAENDAPPRVVWVPGQGTFSPVDHPGGSPRCLTVRTTTVYAHIWAADACACDEIMAQIITALAGQASGSVSAEGERWVTQEKPAWVTCGELLVFEFRVSLAVRDALQAKTYTSAKILTADLAKATGAAGDGAIEHGENSP